MKIPSEGDLESALHRLSRGEAIESDYATYAQWVRFDPRLGEAWLKAVSKHWSKLNPLVFRSENLKVEQPAVMGVLLDQCDGFLIEASERRLFRAWRNLILSGVPPASGEIFLIGFHPFGSESLMNEMILASRVYRKWGFGGKDIFLNKFLEKQQVKQKSILDRSVREEILKKLLKTKKRITVSDYLHACDHRISRRVAQKDLIDCPKLRPIGSSRARFYVLA